MKNRVAVLDGLRALAIALVLARHAVRPFGTDTVVFLNGWMGVDLFFVLSGYLITTQLMEGGALKDYLRRRFFRIAPAYYLVLTVLACGVVPGFPEGGNAALWWRYFYHLLFLQDYFPPNISVVFWSLAIEAKFYLAAPFLLALIMRLDRPRRYAALTGLILAMPLLRWLTVEFLLPPFDGYEAYFSLVRNRFHLCLDGLLAGTLCTLLWRDPAARAMIDKHANILFAAGCAVIAALLLPTELLGGQIGLFQKTLLPTAIACGFAAIMLGLLGGSRGQSIFSWHPLSFIARISYSLYLVHMPVQRVVTYLLPVDQRTLSHTWLPYLIFSAAVAAALYYLVEKPMIERGKAT